MGGFREVRKEAHHPLHNPITVIGERQTGEGLEETIFGIHAGSMLNQGHKSVGNIGSSEGNAITALGVTGRQSLKADCYQLDAANIQYSSIMFCEKPSTGLILPHASSERQLRSLLGSFGAAELEALS